MVSLRTFFLFEGPWVGRYRWVSLIQKIPACLAFYLLIICKLRQTYLNSVLFIGTGDLFLACGLIFRNSDVKILKKIKKKNKVAKDIHH